MKSHEDIERELQKHPGVDYEFARRGKHPSVILKVGDRQKYVVFTGTRTDPRGMKNKIAQIRRVIREISG